MSATISEHYETIVIGGGFYGCRLAVAFARSGQRVAVFESEAELMSRASYVNQARVHNGYHYPRSYLTALRSAANFPRFVAEFPDCIDNRFEHIYAIARNHSKVSANQFKRFCSLINAPLQHAPQRVVSLLNSDLIEDAFCVTEYAFDALALRKQLSKELDEAEVCVFCSTPVRRVFPERSGRLRVHLQDDHSLIADQVINCAYSSINDLLRRSGLLPLPLKYELAEIALIAVPEPLNTMGITVIDGPFFSTMPFPPRELHSLTHVRYTPHEAWHDTANGCRSSEKPSSNYAYMLKDAQRYLPPLQHSQYHDSLFEVKAIRIQNEVDDGRPILFRKDYGMKKFSIVMGSKIDNIYDVLEAIEKAGLLKEVNHGANARSE